MIALIIHNPDHRRLLDALLMTGLLDGTKVRLASPGTALNGMLHAVIVVDAPEYADRANPAFAANYRNWLDDQVIPRMPPGTKITYLHPAGEPM